MTPALAKPITDFDIQEWIDEHYGFVPHPYWISHCKELFLPGSETPAERRRPWHECPLDKRSRVREAFVYFGLLLE